MVELYSPMCLPFAGYKDQSLKSARSQKGQTCQKTVLKFLAFCFKRENRIISVTCVICDNRY